eukprot:453024-Rhodomonas_salina.1
MLNQGASLPQSLQDARSWLLPRIRNRPPRVRNRLPLNQNRVVGVIIREKLVEGTVLVMKSCHIRSCEEVNVDHHTRVPERIEVRLESGALQPNGLPKLEAPEPEGGGS